MRTVCPVLAAIPVGCMAQCIYNDMTSGLRSDFADKANQCRALGAECALTGVTVGGIESCEAFGMSCCPATTSTTYAKSIRHELLPGNDIDDIRKRFMQHDHIFRQM